MACAEGCDPHQERTHIPFSLFLHSLSCLMVLWGPDSLLDLYQLLIVLLQLCTIFYSKELTCDQPIFIKNYKFFQIFYHNFLNIKNNLQLPTKEKSMCSIMRACNESAKTFEIVRRLICVEIDRFLAIINYPKKRASISFRKKSFAETNKISNSCKDLCLKV